MMVDISHVSDATMAGVLRVSEAPVIYSHSSARALCDVPRNVSDDILRRLPANGGVVMVNFYAGFVPPDCAARNRLASEVASRIGQQFPGDSSAQNAAIAKWEAANPPKATLSQVADHIDHIRQVAGTDHIGIGSDFDGIDGLAPVGLEDVSKYPALVAELLRRGYSDADVEKIIGLNLLRAMRSAERVAATLQARRGPSTATIEQLDGNRK
jgi:membrane dipeptidase